MRELTARLATRRARGLYRERLVLASAQGVHIRVGDETLLSFCSNDYLGLANDPRVVAAFCAGAERYGAGAGASHLISGHTIAHQALEEELADFVGSPRALLFSTGYMANLGVVTALSDRHSIVFEDKLNHASLIDAARLTQAKVKRYPHADMERLTTMLANSAVPSVIASDAVFSMDGDLAPLQRLLPLARAHKAWLLVDDAHGIGVLGPGGRGSLAHLDIATQAPVILMGTLGKAFGVFGAFVAGDEPLIETLIQHARTYIYTTALPPAVAEATRASLQIVRSEEWRRERLQSLVDRFVEQATQMGLSLTGARTPIQPVILGSPEAAVAASRTLRAQGILVPAIRPPTVAPGTSRLRITFSAAHEPAHVDRLLQALAQLSDGGS
ncbi:MAG: 8-amino-7-oxononanoate synthase [Gammaproteobacteria bacterium]|nr:8-amino-7-oxononanoate synthase [Gammaproteobacteria bacterium]